MTVLSESATHLHHVDTVGSTGRKRRLGDIGDSHSDPSRRLIEIRESSARQAQPPSNCRWAKWQSATAATQAICDRRLSNCADHVDSAILAKKICAFIVSIWWVMSRNSTSDPPRDCSLCFRRSYSIQPISAATRVARVCATATRRPPVCVVRKQRGVARNRPDDYLELNRRWPESI